MDPEASVIIPTLNEEGAIQGVINGCKRALKDYNSEIIIVDSSKDKTAKLAREAGAKVIEESRKGKGRALRTGVKKSRGKKLAFLDGDGAYPPKYLPEMLDQLERCDMVVCPRKKEIKGIYSILSSLSGLTMSPLFKKFGTSSPWTGMRALWRSSWEKINPQSKGFLIETEIEIESIRNQLKIIEIPIEFLKRKTGASKFWRSPKDWIKIIRYVRKNREIFDRKIKTHPTEEGYKIIKYGE